MNDKIQIKVELSKEYLQEVEELLNNPRFKFVSKDEEIKDDFPTAYKALTLSQANEIVISKETIDMIKKRIIFTFEQGYTNTRIQLNSDYEIHNECYRDALAEELFRYGYRTYYVEDNGLISINVDWKDATEFTDIETEPQVYSNFTDNELKFKQDVLYRRLTSIYHELERRENKNQLPCDK